jgi:hypothetical protein
VKGGLRSELFDRMTVDHEGKTPVCQQIADILRGQIEWGEIVRPPGARRRASS